MDGKTGESIEGIKRKIHKETSVGSTGSELKNEDGDKCIGLCNERGIINRI